MVDDQRGQLFLGILGKATLVDFDGIPIGMRVIAIRVKQPMTEVVVIEMQHGHIGNQIVVHVVHIDGIQIALRIGDGLDGILEFSAALQIVAPLQAVFVEGQQQVGYGVGTKHIYKLLSA